MNISSALHSFES